jgi:hypothetical protein
LDWEIEFYQKENDEISVEDFLLSLNPKLRAKAYSDILLKKMGIKTPERELEKALSYKLDYERRCQNG